MLKSALARGLLSVFPGPARWAINRSALKRGHLLHHWVIRQEIPKLCPEGVVCPFGDITLYVHGQQWEFYRHGDQAGREEYERLLPTSGVVVDVGAHVGLYSILAARRLGARGLVHAFEPSPQNLPLLRRNVSPYANIRIHETAAGAEHTSVTFHLADGLNDAVTPGPYAPVRGTVSVPVTPIDDLIEGPVVLIKMDVQGHEPEALRGMSRLIANSPAVTLLMEWAPLCLRPAGHDPLILTDLLYGLGFTIDNIVSSDGNRDSLTDLLAYISDNPDGRRYWDITARRSRPA